MLDQRPMYGGGGPRSFYGEGTRQGSIYGDVPRAGSFYGAPDPRTSTFSYGGPQMTQVPPGMPDTRQSSYSLAAPLGQDFRTSSHSLAPERPAAFAESRPQSFLPELDTAAAGQLNAGAESIPVADLESSIRRICQGADLDTMTKKHVRRQLEEEYGVSLASRKDELGRLVEDVLAGQSTSPTTHSYSTRLSWLTQLRDDRLAVDILRKTAGRSRDNDRHTYAPLPEIGGAWIPSFT